jgi:hypothetical protein
MTSLGPTILKAMGVTEPRFGDKSPLDIWKLKDDGNQK